jgi:hypothetical protein
MGNRIIRRFIPAALVFFLLAACLIAVSGCGRLQIKASVAGYVYMNNRPMPNWEVQLVDPNSGRVVRSEKSNQQGHFIIADVPPGDY